MRVVRGNAWLAAVILVALVTGVFTIYPLVWVLVEAAGAKGLAGIAMSTIVLLQQGRVQSAIENTAVTTAISTVIALIAGIALAWLYVKSDVPFKIALASLAYFPLLTTPLVNAVAWQLIGGGRIGLLNTFLRTLIPAVGPNGVISSESLLGIGWTMGLFHAPFVFAFVSAALQRVPSSMEEAGYVSGATGRTVLRTVILPLVAPAVLASALTISVLEAGNFAVPAILGSPNGINTVSTLIYQKMNLYPADIRGAASLGLVLVGLVVVLLGLQRLLLGNRDYAGSGGKGLRVRRTALGGYRVPITLAVGAYFAVAVILPGFVLVWTSLVPYWDGRLVIGRMNLEAYRHLLGDPSTLGITVGTVWLAVVSALIGAAISFAVAYAVVRRHGRSSSALELAAVLPLAIPGIGFAIGVLNGWIGLPLGLYGSLGLLGVAYIGKGLPTGVQTMTASFRQVSQELEESSRVCGASIVTTIRRIVLPLVLPGVVAAWGLLFVMFMRELPDSILLYAPSSEVLSVRMFLLWTDGNFNQLAALSFVVSLLSLVGVLIARRFERSAWSEYV